jgi:Bacterial aa3 type cytochrome c oxidase subunit IV
LQSLLNYAFDRNLFYGFLNMALENKLIGTAPNDYKEHNATYDLFVRLTAVWTPTFITWLVGLGIGAVKGSWFLATVMILLSMVAGAIGTVSKELSYKPAAAVLVLSLLTLLVA